jgi:hypothetical protein
MRNDGEFCAARLKIEDGISRGALRKEGLLRLQLDDSSPHSSRCQEVGEVKSHALYLKGKDLCTG